MMIRQADYRRPLDEVQNVHLLVCLSLLWLRGALGVEKVAKHEKLAPIQKESSLLTIKAV